MTLIHSLEGSCKGNLKVTYADDYSVTNLKHGKMSQRITVVSQFPQTNLINHFLALLNIFYTTFALRGCSAAILVFWKCFVTPLYSELVTIPVVCLVPANLPRNLKANPTPIRAEGPNGHKIAVKSLKAYSPPWLRKGFNANPCKVEITE